MPPARGNRHPGRTPAKAGRAGIQKPLNGWIPALEGVRKLTICWINALRRSRQLLRSFLRACEPFAAEARKMPPATGIMGSAWRASISDGGNHGCAVIERY